MPAKKPPPLDEKPQSERFIEAALEVGASDDPKDFERAFAIFTSNQKADMRDGAVSDKVCSDQN